MFGDPFDVTPILTDWQDMDLSDFIPEKASVAIIRATGLFGLRKKGSSDNRTYYAPDGGTVFYVGLDVDRVCQGYRGSFALLGYMMGGGYYKEAECFLNAVPKTFTGQYLQNIDVSDNDGVPADAKFVLLDVVQLELNQHSGNILSLSDALIFQIYTNWNTRIFVTGYINSDIAIKKYDNFFDPNITTKTKFYVADVSTDEDYTSDTAVALISLGDVGTGLTGTIIPVPLDDNGLIIDDTTLAYIATGGFFYIAGFLSYYPESTGEGEFTIQLRQSGTAIGAGMATGITELYFEQYGDAIGTGMATGQSVIFLSQSGLGVEGVVATGLSSIYLGQSGEGFSGIIASGESTIRFISSGTFLSSVDGTGQSVIEFTQYGLASYGIIGSGESTIRMILHGEATSGLVGSGESILRMVTEGSGFGSTIGTGLSTIVFLQSGSALFNVVTSDNYCIVINTRTGVVSEYTNYGFDSVAELNGKLVGCGTDGFYELNGDNDNGVPIDAHIKWHSLDASFQSRSQPDRGYLTGECSGSLLVTTTADESLSSRSITQYLPGRREHLIKIGKGLVGRLYDTKIQNINGSSFAFNMYRMITNIIRPQRYR